MAIMGSRHGYRCGFRATLVGFGVILIIIFSLVCLRREKDNSVVLEARSVSDCSVPYAPDDLRINGTGSSRWILWNPGSSGTGNISNSCPVSYYLQFKLINRDQCMSYNGDFFTKTVTTDTSYLLSQATSSLPYYSTYQIRVMARSSAGFGTPSSEISTTTSKAAPNAPPANVRPTGVYSDRVDFEWDEVPCGSRQGDITRYEYRLKRSTSFAYTRNGEVSVRLVSIGGLSPCTEYQFQVAAIGSTSSTPGPYSGLIQVETLAEGPVSNVYAVAETSSPSIRVTWTPPAASGAICTLRYIVEYRLTNRDQCQPISQSEPVVAGNQTTDSKTIYGLEGYSTYEVCIKTWNLDEYSAERCRTTTTTNALAPTAPPANVTCTNISTNRLDFAWDQVPCGNRSGPIMEYQYQLTPTSGDGSPLTRTVTSRSCSVRDGVASCTEYEFQVRARRTTGHGPYSDVMSVTTAAKAHGPINTPSATALEDSTSIQITWSPPDTSDNNCALHYILEYELIVRDLCDYIPHPERVFAGNQTSTSQTITGLQAYSTYNVSIRTWNQEGDSEARHTTISTSSAQAPSMSPSNITVSRRRDGITIEWDEIPCGYRHGEIIKYQIKCRVLEKPYKLDFTPHDTYEQVPVVPPLKMYISKQLEPSTKYEFLIAGENHYEVGKWAKIETFTLVETEMDPPPVPTNDEAKSTNSTVTIHVRLPTTSQYITGMQIGVTEVHSDMEEGATKSETDLTPDYVAAEMMKANLIATFTVGDGNKYGPFNNQPLKPDTQYDIYLGSVSRISNEEFAVTWGKPLRVKVKANYVFPFAAVLAPALMVVLLALLIPGAFIIRKRRRRPSEDDAHFTEVADETRLQDFQTPRAVSNPYSTEETTYELMGNHHESQSQKLAYENQVALPKEEGKAPPAADTKMAALGNIKHVYPYENMAPLRIHCPSKAKLDSEVKEVAGKRITRYGTDLKSNSPEKEVHVVYDIPRAAVRPTPKPRLRPPAARRVAPPVHLTDTHGPPDDAISVSELQEYVRTRKSASYRGGNGFLEDFEKLSTPVKHSISVAKKHPNKAKNRYANILPYDQSRVVLENVADDLDSDYVNASYIDGYDEPRKYIASQGPTTASVDDMWRMVWQENTSKIVMLTNLREGVKEKCEKYWPDDTTTYGNITVRLMSESTHDDYVTRDFTIANKSKKQLRKVVQFHWTAWPVDGLPEDVSKFITFLRTVIKQTACAERTGPLLVHCSTGTSRTGLFITLDAMLDQAKKEGRVRIGNFIRRMDDMRMGMIQSATHFEYIFDVLLEALKIDKTTN